MEIDFVLASRSPRRIELLKKAGYKFEVIPALGDESTPLTRPHAMVKDLALKKAFEVACKYPAYDVVGADTLVYCKGRVIGKPKDKKDALRMLRLLNGAWQSVYTGVAVINKDKKKILCAYDVTRCKARNLSNRELLKIADKHLDKAGGYAMQDKEDPLIEKVCGSESNVVGMPMELFKEMYKSFSPIV